MNMTDISQTLDSMISNYEFDSCDNLTQSRVNLMNDKLYLGADLEGMSQMLDSMLEDGDFDLCDDDTLYWLDQINENLYEIR